MPAYIAFLRAVNVGGRMVKMAALRERLADHGFTEVQTFIASGNVRVTSTLRSPAKVEKALEDLLAEWLDFEVPTMVRTPTELERVYADGADLESPVSGSPRHYVSFLKQEPAGSAVEKLHAWDKPLERAQVRGREVHLWLGSERPRLTNAAMEKILGTAGTARDWKTVTTLASTWT